MNRRQFTTRLGALAAVPALPVKAMAGAVTRAGAIPNGARFWAIYMTSLHGTCSAQTLTTMTGITPSAAQGYLARMVSDGIIKPSRLAANVVSQAPDARRSKTAFKKRLEKFSQEKSTANPMDLLDDQEDESDETNQKVPDEQTTV